MGSSGRYPSKHSIRKEFAWVFSNLHIPKVSLHLPVVMTTGAGYSADTYRATKSAGAINWGCFSIKKRRSIGGFQVGCYVVEDFDGNISGHEHWKYFAMCNHGNKSHGADTRKDVIIQAKMSMDYCSKCASLFEQHKK
mgnify:CR=1 FL=1